jgi:hypothetical protein
MKVIAVSGWKGSGKDTLAAHLIDKFGAVRTSFADPLKDMVAEEYGIDRTSLDDPGRKERALLHLPVNPQDPYSRMIAEFLIKEFRTTQGIQPTDFTYQNGDFYGVIGDISTGQTVRVYWTPRALAILKGSTNRSVRSNYWVKRAVEEVARKAADGFELHVISDLRYQSEMQQLKDTFGSDVVFVRVNRFEESPSKDPSERDLDNATFDFYVNNKGTKEEAFARMEDILRQVTVNAQSA